MENSLKNFQEEIRRYFKKSKSRKKNENKLNHSEIVGDYQSRADHTKFPSIYGNEYQPARNNQNAESKLLKKIQEHQKKIRDLQIEQEAQEKLNKRIFKQMTRNKYPRRQISHNSFYQQPARNQPVNIPQKQTSNFACQTSQTKLIIKNPTIKTQISITDNLPREETFKKVDEKTTFEQPKTFIPKEKKSEKKVQQIKGKSRKFRIIGIAVLFTIIYPKYSRSFTIRRFNKFKKKFIDVQENPIERAEQRLISLVRGENLFLRPQKKNESIQKSSISSFRSHQVPQSQSQAINVQIQKINREILDKVNSMNQIFLGYQIQPLYEFLCLFWRQSFRLNGLFSETQLKAIRWHSIKHYSKGNLETTKFLLIRMLYMNVFFKKKLLNAQATQQKKINNLIFYFICRNHISQYFQKLVKTLKNQQIKQNEQLIANLRGVFDKVVVQTEDENDHIEVVDFMGLINEKMEGYQKQILLAVEGGIQKLMQKLKKFNKQQYDKLKQQTIKNKFLKVENNYFQTKQWQYEGDELIVQSQQPQRTKTGKSKRSRSKKKKRDRY